MLRMIRVTAVKWRVVDGKDVIFTGQLKDCRRYIFERKIIRIGGLGLIALLVTAMAFANPPICEIYNIDTDKCETFADQNVTFSDEWNTFKYRPNASTQAELHNWMQIKFEGK